MLMGTATAAELCAGIACRPTLLRLARNCFDRGASDDDGLPTGDVGELALRLLRVAWGGPSMSA
jgi:hypothetical protein